MTKITLSGTILVPKKDLKAVLSELPTHIELTHQEAGCIKFTVTQDTGNPHRFEVYETFKDQTAFDKHQARVKASNWGKVAKSVERFYTITEE